MRFERFISLVLFFEMIGTLLCATGACFDGEKFAARVFILISIAFLICKTGVDNAASQSN